MTDHMHVDDPRVAAVLAAAAAPAEGPLPGEAQALTVFRSVHRPGRRRLMSRLSENAKLVAAAIFGGVVVISGAAAAATGSLPLVGASHANPHATASHAPDANDQGTDVEGTDTSTDTAGDAQDVQGGQGDAISQLAHQLKASGATHRGQTICVVASSGKCQAGQHGQSGAATHGQAALPHGQSDATTHGQSDATTHGQSDATTHGKADATTHGQSDATTHGQAGLPHGNAPTS